MAMHRTELVTKYCVVCNSPFQVTPPGKASRNCRKKYEAEYCSRECRNKARYRNGSPCNKLIPEQAAYIAGFLDGEGSIMIYERPKSLSLRVAFSNTKIEVLEWIANVTGNGNIISSNHNNTKHSTAYNLLVNSLAGATLLEQVVPYLIIKKRQAELGIEFFNKLKIPNLKADRQWQDEARSLMQELNKRNISHR